MNTTAPKTAILSADMRNDAGKGSARALRREGKVPGIVYSNGSQPMSIALQQKEVSLEYARGRFRSRLIDIKLADGKTIKALPKDLQFHPVTDVIEHVDFIRVEAGAKLRVSIPLKFIGQEKSVGLKRGGVLNIVRHEIEFFCTPENMPQIIEISVQQLDIGNSVHINDIQLPDGISPVIKRNFTIAAVAGRSAEEEEVKPVAAAATDAAAPAAGAAAPAAGAAAAAPAADAKKDAKK